MSKGVVRLGDYCAEVIPHFCVGGSNNVFVNNRPICRYDDNLTEGRIITQGSRTVFSNGYGIARIGDAVSCGSKVISGSPNVFCN